jgi:hypothetical protein
MIRRSADTGAKALHSQADKDLLSHRMKILRTKQKKKNQIQIQRRSQRKSQSQKNQSQKNQSQRRSQVQSNQPQS